MANAFELAASQLGMNETDQQVALQEFLANGGVNLDPAVTAWCAAFVNATLEQTGQQGTGSNAARSFLDWGQEVSEPQRGDLAVFSRGDPNGWQGHVGFFDGYNEDGSIRVLGGNQSDAVNVSNYEASRLLGFRRGDQSSTVAQPNPQARNPLAQPQNALSAPQSAPENAMTAVQQQQAAMQAFMPRVNALSADPFQNTQRAQPVYGFGAGNNPFVG